MSLPFYFISLIILIGSILLLARGFSGGTSYFNRRRLMNQLEDHHERLRQKRKDLLHHFYWAESNNETSRANALENQIVELDREIEEVTEEYNKLKSGKSITFKGVKS